MKLLTFISVVFILFGNIFSQECLVLNGAYQGMNVYVQNPFASNGVGFSTQKVTVNGEPITDNIISSTFEIDLKKWNFKYGDSINIKIYHDVNCSPRIIDDLALTYPAILTYKNVELDSTGLLIWCAVNEVSSKTFYIEQYKCNRWAVIGQVRGNGGDKKNCYEFQVDLHSGENKVRLVQETHGYNNNQRKSPIVKTVSNLKEVELLTSKGFSIIFSNDTHFEIYNTFGVLKMKGLGRELNLKKLPLGLYYVNYDNTTGTVFRKI